VLEVKQQKEEGRGIIQGARSVSEVKGAGVGGGEKMTSLQEESRTIQNKGKEEGKKVHASPLNWKEWCTKKREFL